MNSCAVYPQHKPLRAQGTLLVMNILVTGGAGYIGSVTAQHLVHRGHEVVVLDNLQTGHRAAVPQDAQFYLGDIRDSELVTRIIAEHEITAVIHFAAVSLVGESMTDPLKYFTDNTVATLTLLDTVVRSGVERIIFSSTATLYGVPDVVPIPETAPVRITNVYGETKWTIERALAWLQQLHGIGFTTLRYFNACGAAPQRGEDHTPETHLIPIVLEVAAGKRDSVTIFGTDYDTVDGTNIRDYVHVLDLAHAHALAVEALQPGDANTYNVGLGVGYSVREIIDVCRAVTEHEIPAVAGARRAGDPPVLVADSTRIRQELGWEPRWQSIAGIVQSAWDWHAKHPNGYRSKSFAEGW